jgi:ubiquinone biosynthesis accessory factor UbiK
MEQNRFEDLARKLLESIPPSLRAAQKDLETNFRSALRTGLSRLDMVTRDEFDAQARVLERSRELIEALEKRVAQLEAQQGTPVSSMPQD